MPLELLWNPVFRALTSAGAVAPLAKANFWAAGGVSVRQNTYKDYLGVTPNDNPVAAGSDGLFGPIFLLPLPYRLVITDTTGTITLFDQDNFYGPNYAALFDDKWQLKDNLDASKILMFQLSSITTATTRTVTVPDANGTMLLTTLAKMGAAPFMMSRGTNVTAANDITLTQDGNLYNVTGNTQINRIAAGTWQEGTMLTLQFSGTPTVKHGQTAGGGFNTILLNGSADFVAASGMAIQLQLISNTWTEIPRRS